MMPLHYVCLSDCCENAIYCQFLPKSSIEEKKQQKTIQDSVGCTGNKNSLKSSGRTHTSEKEKTISPRSVVWNILRQPPKKPRKSI